MLRVFDAKNTKMEIGEGIERGQVAVWLLGILGIERGQVAVWLLWLYRIRNGERAKPDKLTFSNFESQHISLKSFDLWG